MFEKPRTFRPKTDVPEDKWVKPINFRGKRTEWQIQGDGTNAEGSWTDSGSKRKDYISPNYKGKNPMTRTQWRRYQRSHKNGQEGSKMVQAGFSHYQSKPFHRKLTEEQAKIANERLAAGMILGKKLIKELVDDDAPILNTEKEPEYSPLSDEEVDDNFDIESDKLLIDCGIVSVLPAEFDRISEVSENEDDFLPDENVEETLVCYYVMGKGVVEEQKAVFENPGRGMMYHLKPLFIRAKVDGVPINKVFVDGGAAVNLMPYSSLQKVGKSDKDLRPHNMVLSNYEGKTSGILGVIQVKLVVGSTVRSTIFMVIASQANFKLLLGREWIHGIGAVPSTLHQRVAIWRPDGIVENVEADQSYYKIENGRKHFDQHLANVAPCYKVEEVYSSDESVSKYLNLDPNYGFIWNKEDPNEPLNHESPPEQRTSVKDDDH